MSDASVFTINRPWGPMACCDSGGAGVPLVFLHGSGCDWTDWDATFEHLPSDIRQIAMDFRAHGRNDAPDAPFTFEDLTDDVIALADYLGLAEMVLVGHSLGGMVALDAARRDSRVKALVLLEGWTNWAAIGAFNDPSHTYGRLPDHA